MNRLLQGDVGSGKTIVALLSMLIIKDNDFQSCLMALPKFSPYSTTNPFKKQLEVYP